MIQVVAAIILKDGFIFIAQRPSFDDLAFKWELPGGKIEPGEKPKESLCREVAEELQMEIAVGDFLGESIYAYPKITVKLLAYWAKWIKGEPKLSFHAAYNWITVNQLEDYDFAPADIPLINKIQVNWNISC